jgi:hypothetical protein
MTCPTCGTSLSAGAVECPLCGTEVSATPKDDETADRWREWLDRKDGAAPPTADPADDDGEPLTRSRVRPVVITGVLAGLAVLLVALLLPRNGSPVTQPPGGGTPRSSGAGSSDSPLPVSPTTPIPVNIAKDAAQVTASATSKDIKDSAGRLVSFSPSNVADGDPATVWRMDGDGSDATLTFFFGSPRTFTALGLINGDSGEEPPGKIRYAAERRITRVTWDLGNLKSVTQSLTDGAVSMQVEAIDPIAVSSVTLHIESTTSAAGAGSDFTAIGEVQLLAYP